MRTFVTGRRQTWINRPLPSSEGASPKLVSNSYLVHTLRETVSQVSQPRLTFPNELVIFIAYEDFRHRRGWLELWINRHEELW